MCGGNKENREGNKSQERTGYYCPLSKDMSCIRAIVDFSKRGQIIIDCQRLINELSERDLVATFVGFISCVYR